MSWAQTEHLVLEHDGDVWLWLDPGYRCLGPIAEAYVDVDLEGELAELLDAWCDAPCARDVRAEWDATYRRQSGV